MSTRPPRNEMLMIRMAAEGIPIAAIARVACVSPALARVTLEAGKAHGFLAELPPEEWANPLHVERALAQLPVEQIAAFADELLELGLTGGQSRFTAAVAICGTIANPQLQSIATTGAETSHGVIKVYACQVRKKLQPYGVTIETLWGRGYRMDEVSRLKLMAAVGTLEKRRAS